MSGESQKAISEALDSIFVALPEDKGEELHDLVQRIAEGIRREDIITRNTLESWVAGWSEK